MLQCGRSRGREDFKAVNMSKTSSKMKIIVLIILNSVKVIKALIKNNLSDMRGQPMH